jgi:predicted transposase/invertase (TIGR01784 family)
MQSHIPWSFNKRVVYYWARFHGRQLLEGEYYETIRPTYSFWFVSKKVFADSDHHHRFVLYDPEHKLLLSKDLEIHIIELSKFTLPAQACLTQRDRWCYFLKYGAVLDGDRLPATLDSPIFRQAMEVLNVLGQTEIERERYEASLKARLDAGTLRYEAEHAEEIGRARGLEQGLEQGHKEGILEGCKEGHKEGHKEGLNLGREEGELLGRIHLCQRMLKLPLTPREELLSLPVAELAERARLLEQNLLPKDNGQP